MRNLKRESRIAVCCGSKPTAIVVFRGESIANAFVVNDPKEVLEDSRFWEVMYEDGCGLGLKEARASERQKRIACLLWLLAKGMWWEPVY